MTSILTRTPTLEILYAHEQSTDTRQCQNIITDTTGERATWVAYNPAEISAVVHLWSPNHSARFLLGASGYRHAETITTGELWIREAAH